MKALILNGETAELRIDRCVPDTLESWFREHGVSLSTLSLAEMDIGYCTGCFGCWVKTPGICVIDDDGRDLTRRAVQSDLLILLTPVTFGGYSSELKRALDRIIGFVSPFFQKISGETHHKMRYSTLPRLVSFGIIPEYDELSIQTFHSLVARNGINMHQEAWSEVLVTSAGENRARERIVNTLKEVCGEK